MLLNGSLGKEKGNMTHMKSEEPTRSDPEGLKPQGSMYKPGRRFKKLPAVLRSGPGTGSTTVRAALGCGPVYEISSALKKPLWTIGCKETKPISNSKLSLIPVVPAGT